MEGLRGMAARLDDPSVKAKFEGFDRDLQFRFQDIGLECFMRIRGGQATVEEGSLEAPHIVITTDSDTMLGILRGEVSGMSAFMRGKLKAEGSMPDLLKLQSIMKG